MGSFKVDFNILDYDKKGLLPSLDEYCKSDEIINYKEFEKGNVDNCFWQRILPTQEEIQSESFRELEVKRIIKTGAWIAIKDTVVWLPPNYYFALKYGSAGARPMQFRLKRLKHVYHKLEARKNPACKGTLTIKNRGDGETTMAITDAFWECLDGNTEIGQMGIQSKTRNDCINPCWMYVQVLWQCLPHWLKNELCSDFHSRDNIAEKMKWMREADEERGIPARNILFTFYPSGTPMDGKHDVIKCILDEVCKWEECNFFDTYTNYTKFIMPGIERRGMFDMFSSPADKDCKSNQEVKLLWDLSDMAKINPETGTTPSRIHRIYSNPLDGIPGFYDKFGDVDRDQIYQHIMRERAAQPKDKLLGEIRGYPLTEDEMWGSADVDNIWSNTDGIKKRQIYLIGRRFKNDDTKEPKYVFGNLEWIDGHIDSDVAFRQADVADFDITKARFCFSYLPDEEQKAELRRSREGKPLPPKYIENMLGIDPFNHRYATKDKSRQSNASMVNRIFRDVLNRGINRCPNMIYDCRPSHQEVMFEDAIKAAVFNRALIQYENRSDKFANYAEDRGYFDWLLPEIGAAKDSERKGDAPTGKGNFLVEGMGLIDAATNKPLRDSEPYDLELYWFERLLAAYLKFDPKNTQVHNLVMADMQALVGIVKALHKKIRQPSEVNSAVLDFLLN
jgi:hypothetical protein